MRNPLGLSRWDIIEGYYAFYTDYHTGQWSKEYSRLSRMKFRPGPMWRTNRISPGAQMVYEGVVSRYGYPPVPDDFWED